MRTIDADLTAEAEKYVVSLLNNRLSEEYLFHSVRHTMNVVKGAELIGKESGLNESELKILKISALFHDVGYTITNEDHEAESAFIAGEFLRSKEVDEDQMKQVENAIMATRVPQQPKDRISGVLCDADLLHLTSEDYFEQMELLRLEWQVTGKNFFTEYQFHQNSLDFFKGHHYHSEYGRKVLEARKQIVLMKIRDRMEELE